MQNCLGVDLDDLPIILYGENLNTLLNRPTQTSLQTEQRAKQVAEQQRDQLITTTADYNSLLEDKDKHIQQLTEQLEQEKLQKEEEFKNKIKEEIIRRGVKIDDIRKIEIFPT